MVIIRRLKLLLDGYVIMNCGYRGSHELWLPRYSRIVVTVVCFLLHVYINKAIKGPSMRPSLFSSSDVIATTCFGHTSSNNIGGGEEELLL
jgi:hypothetical protein